MARLRILFALIVIVNEAQNLMDITYQQLLEQLGIPFTGTGCNAVADFSSLTVNLNSFTPAECVVIFQCILDGGDPAQFTELLQKFDMTQLTPAQCQAIFDCLLINGTPAQFTQLLQRFDMTQLLPDQCVAILQCILDNGTPAQFTELLQKFDMSTLTTAQCAAIAQCIVDNPAALTLIRNATLPVDSTEVTLVDGGDNWTSTTLEELLNEIATRLTGLAHTVINSIDLRTTANANEFVVEIAWTDADGNTQTTTDPTPVIIDFSALTPIQCQAIFDCLNTNGTPTQFTTFINNVDWTTLSPQNCRVILDCILDNGTPTQWTELLQKFNMADLTDAQCDELASLMVSSDAQNVIGIGSDGKLFVDTRCPWSVDSETVNFGDFVDGTVSQEHVISVPGIPDQNLAVTHVGGQVPAGGSWVALQVGTAPGLSDVFDGVADGFTADDASSAGAGGYNISLPVAGDYYLRYVRTGANGAVTDFTATFGALTGLESACDALSRLDDEVKCNDYGSIVETREVTLTITIPENTFGDFGLGRIEFSNGDIVDVPQQIQASLADQTALWADRLGGAVVSPGVVEISECDSGRRAVSVDFVTGAAQDVIPFFPGDGVQAPAGVYTNTVGGFTAVIDITNTVTNQGQTGLGVQVRGAGGSLDVSVPGALFIQVELRDLDAAETAGTSSEAISSSGNATINADGSYQGIANNGNGQIIFQDPEVTFEADWGAGGGIGFTNIVPFIEDTRIAGSFSASVGPVTQLKQICDCDGERFTDLNGTAAGNPGCCVAKGVYDAIDSSGAAPDIALQDNTLEDYQAADPAVDINVRQTSALSLREVLRVHNDSTTEVGVNADGSGQIGGVVIGQGVATGSSGSNNLIAGFDNTGDGSTASFSVMLGSGAGRESGGTPYNLYVHGNSGRDGVHQNSMYVGLGAGRNSGTAADPVNNIIAIGNSAGRDAAAGTANNTYLGPDAGNGSGGSNNFGSGQAVLRNNPGSNNVAIGSQVGNDQDFSNAVVVGHEAALGAGDRTEMVAIGHLAAQGATDSTDGVAIGSAALFGSTGGGLGAVAIGHNAARSANLGGFNSVAIGNDTALNADVDGMVAVGGGAGGAAVGFGHVALGSAAGNGATGQSVISIGRLAGAGATVGHMTAIGQGAGQNAQGGDLIGIGRLSLNGNTGSRVLALGTSAGNGNTQSQRVIMGHFELPRFPGEAAAAAALPAAPVITDPNPGSIYIYWDTTDNTLKVRPD